MYLSVQKSGHNGSKMKPWRKTEVRGMAITLRKD